MFNHTLNPDVKPGEIVTFGTYPQTSTGDDKTPIKWRVLQNSGSELFILSEYLLDCKRYHAEFVDTTWHACDLRQWLSDEFYNAAFDANEKKCITTTLCTDNGECSRDTEDKVFLPSVAEVKELTGIIGKGHASTERRAIGTEFAKRKQPDGCHLYIYDKSIPEGYLTENGERVGSSWWWLRTQLGSPSRATFVGIRASIRTYGRVNLPYYGVRPALKLRLR